MLDSIYARGSVTARQHTVLNPKERSRNGSILRHCGYPKLEFPSVDGFQGGEREAVIHTAEDRIMSPVDMSATVISDVRSERYPLWMISGIITFIIDSDIE